MGAVAAVATVIGVGAGIFAGVKQRQEMKKAAAEERKQRAMSNRQQALERQRNIRMAIAQQRAIRAEALQAGVASGAGFNSSSALGAASAITGDTSTSIGSSNTQFATQVGIAQSQNRQADYVQNAQGNTFGDITQLAGAFTNPSVNRGFANFFGL